MRQRKAPRKSQGAPRAPSRRRAGSDTENGYVRAGFVPSGGLSWRVAQAEPSAGLAGDVAGKLTRAICRAAAVGLGKLAESPSDPPGPTPAVLLLAPARGPGQGTRDIPAALLHKPSPGTCRRHCAGVSGQPLAEPRESSALSSPGLCWGEQPRGSFGQGSCAAGALGRGGQLWRRAACALSPNDTGPLGCLPKGRLVQQGPVGRGGRGGSGSAALLLLPFPATARPSPGSLPKACLLARASALAAPACFGSHGMETAYNRALSFSSPRFTHSQAAQGANEQGPACCRDSSRENESKFNAALLCKVLWDAPTELLCTRAGGDDAGMTAPERGLQAALLWA